MLTKNPKKFWGFLQQKKCRSRIPGAMNYIGQKLKAPTATMDRFTYRIDNEEVQRTDSIKDLGVFFGTKLDPVNHINYVVSNAYKILGFINR